MWTKASKQYKENDLFGDYDALFCDNKVKQEVSSILSLLYKSYSQCDVITFLMCLIDDIAKADNIDEWLKSKKLDGTDKDIIRTLLYVIKIDLYVFADDLYKHCLASYQICRFKILKYFSAQWSIENCQQYLKSYGFFIEDFAVLNRLLQLWGDNEIAILDEKTDASTHKDISKQIKSIITDELPAFLEQFDTNEYTLSNDVVLQQEVIKIVNDLLLLDLDNRIKALIENFRKKLMQRCTFTNNNSTKDRQSTSKLPEDSKIEKTKPLPDTMWEEWVKVAENYKLVSLCGEYDDQTVQNDLQLLCRSFNNVFFGIITNLNSAPNVEEWLKTNEINNDSNVILCVIHHQLAQLKTKKDYEHAGVDTEILHSVRLKIDQFLLRTFSPEQIKNYCWKFTRSSLYDVVPLQRLVELHIDAAISRHPVIEFILFPLVLSFTNFLADQCWKESKVLCNDYAYFFKNLMSINNQTIRDFCSKHNLEITIHDLTLKKKLDQTTDPNTVHSDQTKNTNDITQAKLNAPQSSTSTIDYRLLRNIISLFIGVTVGVGVFGGIEYLLTYKAFSAYNPRNIPPSLFPKTHGENQSSGRSTQKNYF